MNKFLMAILLLTFSTNCFSQVYSKFVAATGNYDVDVNPLVCVLCEVNNDTRVADDDLTNYTSVIMPAGVIATIAIKVNLEATASGGTYAGFRLGSSTLAGVLPKVTVKVSKDGADVQTIINDLDFLSLLSGGSGDLGALTPVGHDYNEVEITFSGLVGGALFNTNVYYGFGGMSSLYVGTLPVKIGEIKQSYRDGGREIAWTAEDDGNTIYEVQRSADGVNFITIGKITSDNNNGNKYFSFFDHAYADTDVFYRVRATEQNASNSFFSKTISASAKIRPGMKIVSIFPNPVAGNKFSIQMPVGSKPVQSVQLIDIKGQVAYKVNSPSGNNGVIQILLKNTLSPGMYVVRVKSDSPSGVISGKILVK